MALEQAPFSKGSSQLPTGVRDSDGCAAKQPVH